MASGPWHEWLLPDRPSLWDVEDMISSRLGQSIFSALFDNDGRIVGSAKTTVGAVASSKSLWNGEPLLA